MKAISILPPFERVFPKAGHPARQAQIPQLSLTSAAFPVWHAFLISTHFARTVVLEQGNTGWYKIQSVFAWACMRGTSIPLAYARSACRSCWQCSS
jgi:hypothetical protein